MGLYESIFAIIASVATIVATVIECKKYVKTKDIVLERERKYYYKFLKPIVNCIYCENRTNLLKIVKKNLDMKKDYIPNYIFYLYDQSTYYDYERKQKKKDYEQYIKLKKVIIFDYIEAYKCIYNKSYYVSKKMGGILDVIKLALDIVLISLSLYCLMLWGILKLFTKETVSTNSLISFAIIFVIAVVDSFFTKLIMKKDKYTFDETEMEKIINDDVKNYDKLKKNNYIVKEIGEKCH